jgi:hypothetical protein
MSTVTSGHLDVSPHADVSARIRVRTHARTRARVQAPCAQVLRRDVSLAQLSRRMSLLDEAAAPVLDSLPFYNDCRRLLTLDGCMTVNLFGRASSFARSVEKISAAFGADAVWAFKPTREGNTVVLAQHTPVRPKRDVLDARADIILARWGLPAPKWVRVFKPL